LDHFQIIHVPEWGIILGLCHLGVRRCPEETGFHQGTPLAWLQSHPYIRTEERFESRNHQVESTTNGVMGVGVVSADKSYLG